MKLLILQFFLLGCTLATSQTTYKYYKTDQAAFKETSDDAVADGVIYRMYNGKLHKRVFDGPASAAWFGAIGDGKANDTKAIQKALNVYGDVFLPVGRFMVDSVVINRLARLKGAGRNKTFLCAIKKDQPFVLAIKMENNLKPGALEEIVVDGFNIDGMNKSINGLYVSIVRASISNIYVSNCKGFGIYHFYGFTNNYTNVWSMYNGNGIILNQEANLNNFIGCIFSLNKNAGVTIKSGAVNSFSGCSIEANDTGVILTYQDNKEFLVAPYIRTVVMLNTFISSFLEANSTDFIINGGEDGVWNTSISSCHFGDFDGEIGLNLVSGFRGVRLQDNYIASRLWNEGVRINGYLTTEQQKQAGLIFSNNILPVESIFINGAILNENRLIASRLLGIEFTELPN